MVRVARLRWTPINAAHIARHGVRINEVEEVVAGERIVEPGHSGRSVLIGPTASGRMLAVVLEPEGGGVFFPVTARPASRKERRRFETTRGGEPA
jgi:uncharacterized DUF497 family protein